MKNDLIGFRLDAERSAPSSSGRDAIRLALRDLKALLPAGSSADVLDAAILARQEAIEHLQSLTAPDGLVDDLRWSCPWLMPRAEALLAGWRGFIAGLSDMIEALRSGRHRRPRDTAIVQELVALQSDLASLGSDESALMFELFNDPPALD